MLCFTEHSVLPKRDALVPPAETDHRAPTIQHTFVSPGGSGAGGGGHSLVLDCIFSWEQYYCWVILLLKFDRPPSRCFNAPIVLFLCVHQRELVVGGWGGGFSSFSLVLSVLKPAFAVYGHRGATFFPTGGRCSAPVDPGVIRENDPNIFNVINPESVTDDAV